MSFKTLIVILLAMILSSMGYALFSLIKSKPESTRTVKALTVRIALSILLIVLLMIGFQYGLITPHRLGG